MYIIHNKLPFYILYRVCYSRKTHYRRKAYTEYYQTSSKHYYRCGIWPFYGRCSRTRYVHIINY